MIAAVVGTDTGIGKTWIACALASALLSAGHSVAARKPAQSFTPGEATDAERLAAVTGEAVESVCPPRWSYAVPMAPPMAADVLGRARIAVGDLAEFATALSDAPTMITIVELVGGVCSPQAHDGDGLALLGLLEPDVAVLVAHAGLGTINAVQLSLRAMRGRDCLPGLAPVVVLNRYDEGADLHRRNLTWLREHGCDAVAGTERGLAGLADRLAAGVPRDGARS